MDRRKKALTDYKKLRAFFVEEEEHFLQEAEKDEGASEDDELADPADRFRSLLQAVSELEKKHRNLGLSMLLQVPPGQGVSTSFHSTSLVNSATVEERLSYRQGSSHSPPCPCCGSGLSIRE
jgi:hypothetical protein